jgi:hypothetical protein
MQHLFYEAFNISAVLYAASRHCLARYARNHSMRFPSAADSASLLRMLYGPFTQ